MIGARTDITHGLEALELAEPEVRGGQLADDRDLRQQLRPRLPLPRQRRELRVKLADRLRDLFDQRER